MSRAWKKRIIFGVDTLLIVAANLFAYYYMMPLILIQDRTWWQSLGVQVVIYWLCGIVLNIFNRVNRSTNLKELLAIWLALTASLAGQLIFHVLITAPYSRRHIVMTYMGSVFLITGSRVLWRLYTDYQLSKDHPGDSQPVRTLIIGAGAGGGILLTTLQNSVHGSELNVVGLVDDDPDKLGTLYYGKKVLGTIDELPNLIEDYEIEMLTVAIPSLPASGYQKIVDIAQDKEVKVNTLPSIEEIASGQLTVSKLRHIDVVDLLGRQEVQLDNAVIENQVKNQTVMVTGAGGSIGSEICRQVMRFIPDKIVLLGHGENSIYLIERELKQTFKHQKTEIIPVIADIQDRKRIFKKMHEFKPTVVYHAAAHKHVPLMEVNPTEAVKNNIYGTKNVVEAAIDAHVESFVMISTDKATNPPNVMGATKRIAEMIVTGLNGNGTKISAVRFGNVLGSRGSVVPVFKEQIEKGGPVTVTDFRMTRYFMTIPEASRLVLQAGAMAKGGEIFILDMGEPVKIYDLAKKMIQLSGYQEDEIEIVETGIRKGEKLYEELLVDKERAAEQVYEKIFVGNIKGFDYDTVMKRVANFSSDPKQLAKEVVAFANESIKES
ncbi:nucleoside-diphosphate sugar epimerase/dehydratase [Vagococcus lutrae]|uniref:polysaccharide biosynthesis protein n=1 Tax=Vagococcus lutrae TaxID=81947 RepID=UPI00288EFA59|nr:nucleoside-diphosphate sugar epimerase/dehydratase [Vagococcus lutrae]MDT2819132.1 nucleoside-diphosphate sugar epimerase/dehydratase [Vagococcus lutrae]MDT2843911.1 nucleoside-diphosphate sugar epimerase/dehydratase [Vagococcus lutrae]